MTQVELLWLGEYGAATEILAQQPVISSEKLDHLLCLMAALYKI